MCIYVIYIYILCSFFFYSYTSLCSKTRNMLFQKDNSKGDIALRKLLCTLLCSGTFTRALLMLIKNTTCSRRAHRSKTSTMTCIINDN